jgi:hypothetical protein
VAEGYRLDNKPQATTDNSLPVATAGITVDNRRPVCSAQGLLGAVPVVMGAGKPTLRGFPPRRTYLARHRSPCGSPKSKIKPYKPHISSRISVPSPSQISRPDVMAVALSILDLPEIR